YLSILKKGQCIVRVNSIERPFLLKVPHIPREWLTITEINNNNALAIEKYQRLKSEDQEKQKTKTKTFFKSISEKGGVLLTKVRNKFGNIMKGDHNKKEKQEFDDLEDEDYLDFYDDEEIPESFQESEESYKQLRKYLDKIYEKQEKSKKISM
ncbi:MAG: hypothetical protein ACFFE4_12585, partial [Candidatus Thorarchaeota archaeon]